MKTLLKVVIIFIFIGSANAGPFMDFDLGFNLTGYQNEVNKEMLSDENPMTIVRAGYETGVYKHNGGLNIRGHGYWQHISSLTGTDSGINLLMFGVRLSI